MTRTLFAVLTVLFGILVIWFLAVAPMNIRVTLDQAARAGGDVFPTEAVERRNASTLSLLLNNKSYIAGGYDLDRPRYPHRRRSAKSCGRPLAP